MTDQEPRSGDDVSATQERSTSRWSILIPAVSLLVGLLIGGAVVGVANDDDDTSSTTSQPTDSPTGSPTAEPSDATTTVVVPDECLEAVDTVEQVTELVRQGASAISDFRTDKLRSLLSELETLDQQARDQVEACREVRTGESPSAE